VESRVSQKYEKLKNLLKELFQLDQPDLDFGLYRIMHARSKEINDFLDRDLLPQVKASFAEYKPADKASIQSELEKVIKAVNDAGMNPDESPKVKELREKLNNESVDITSLEGEVYDHLFRFFRRYYSEGDFISKRVYKEGVYAIPYEGEEVKLHWANADQYYIKTSEYLRDYAFRLNPEDESNPRRVHFRLVDASEGEHGNVKESEESKRVFVLANEDFIVEEDEELIIKFEFRPSTLNDWLPEEREGKKKPPVQKELISNAEQIILAHTGSSFVSWIDDLKRRHIKVNGEQADYSKLVANLNRYTARNTFDYFIHKDLGKFLNRELDFYIKNEVMHLDDVENESAPRVEQYLSKIKVIRKVAKKIIDFLAQLEDFQKKLWLKKKFVVETNYCITLDRVPQECYEEITKNQDQIDEWIKLFAIDEINSSEEELIPSGSVGFTNPLSIEFLKANVKLVLDTKFFDNNFKEELIASIDNFDEQMDGLLIHSENFQALNLLQSRYQEQVDLIHIDPPYNTSTSGFLYKNQFEHSSWMAMMSERILPSKNFMNDNSAILTHIDENEYERLWLIFKNFNMFNLGTIIWDKRNPMTGGRGLANQHEYILCYSKSNITINSNSGNTEEILDFADSLIRQNSGLVDSEIRKKFSDWVNKNSKLSGGEKAYRYLDNEGNVYRAVSLRAPERRADKKFHLPLIHPVTGKPCSVPPNGFSRTPETLKKMINNGEILFGEDESTQPNQKRILSVDKKKQMNSVIQNGKKGKADTDLLGVSFPYCHPVSLYSLLIGSTIFEEGICLDYFAGSGTSGHAIINLNREDGGNRKYILLEVGNHFDDVMKPRIQKVVYSSEWKDGKPISRDTGVSHCFKYLRLESYEDTLNNLVLTRSSSQDSLLNFNANGIKEFREDYLLRYMLNLESTGSKSLLNVTGFIDPTSYDLTVKVPGSDESRRINVDLIETFNYLLGLQIKNISAPQLVTTDFERNSEKRLQIKGRIKEVSSESMKEDSWWFRTVRGKTLDGKNVLVIWRKRPGGETTEGLEKDNLVLDEWFKKMGFSSKDSEFDIIYVNGTNNLENLKAPDDLWKVRLIEEDFHQLMFEDTGE
jgi:adenine-specific DNA-methyltransferase